MAPQGNAGRLDAFDSARGIAIALMVLSHTVTGLLRFNDLPDWGVVPVHLLTKFSSSLFLLVFSFTMVAAYGKRSTQPEWAKPRMKLWRRALLVLVWYKVLLVVQMFEYWPWSDIVRALLWQHFPDYVEILHFYAWALLILPAMMPWWMKQRVLVQLGLIYGLSLLGQLLALVDFGSLWQVRAILIEDKDQFCWGLLTRGPLVLLGMTVAQALLPLHRKHQGDGPSPAAWALLLSGAMLLSLFFGVASPDYTYAFQQLAKNIGKHPPGLLFVTFTFGGAAVFLGLCLMAKDFGQLVLTPFRIVGRQSLFCFVAHILLIFVGYRWALGLRRDVAYEEALGLTLANVVICLLGATAWERWKQSRKTTHEATPLAAELVDITEPAEAPAVLFSQFRDRR